MGRELLSPIQDDVEGESVILEDMVEIQLGGLFGRDVGTGGTEMCHLRQAIDTYVNGVEPGRRREFDDEVEWTLTAKDPLGSEAGGVFRAGRGERPYSGHRSHR